MLTQDNFTKDNIERLQKMSGNDPSLLEKIVYAYVAASVRMLGEEVEEIVHEEYIL